MAQKPLWLGKYEVIVSSWSGVEKFENLVIGVTMNNELTGVIAQEPPLHIMDPKGHDADDPSPWECSLSDKPLTLILCRSAGPEPRKYIIAKETGYPGDVWVAEDEGKEPPD